MPAIETTLGMERGVAGTAGDENGERMCVMLIPYDGITRTGSKGLISAASKRRGTPGRSFKVLELVIIGKNEVY